MTEIVRYGIIDEGGVFLTTASSESLALTSSYYKQGCTIVKLVGQLPEPKRMKKVALFAYRNTSGNVYVGCRLFTEVEAKERCNSDGDTLIKWPFGDVIEVEDL